MLVVSRSLCRVHARHLHPISHVTRHTSHVTRHTSHVTSHTAQHHSQRCVTECDLLLEGFQLRDIDSLLEGSVTKHETSSRRLRYVTKPLHVCEVLLRNTNPPSRRSVLRNNTTRLVAFCIFAFGSFTTCFCWRIARFPDSLSATLRACVRACECLSKYGIYNCSAQAPPLPLSHTRLHCSLLLADSTRARNKKQRSGNNLHLKLCMPHCAPVRRLDLPSPQAHDTSSIIRGPNLHIAITHLVYPITQTHLGIKQIQTKELLKPT